MHKRAVRHVAVELLPANGIRPAGLGCMEQNTGLANGRSKILGQGKGAYRSIACLHPFVAKDDIGLTFLINLERTVEALPCFGRNRAV